ncbi:Thioredoxin domain-containing protein 9 [Galdieria sulphuraria]|uniref:Thioredoxin-like protein n=1 Tax=Galdieria sulphuraria TaxID=130081 RepID=M2XV31_GALSU|nr:thioredoxin-like protein [Galdieria sulphuraria]EME27503.1 thioredoxin-like protein [Galdieria sulphuraria]GJD06442.1 Thioredoxin domain-containing protein 9 [Galdieria sulphuraria]|eukprot:XP_005704023.1 thioredoxin-like protein [Galdieria sulphuraria]
MWIIHFGGKWNFSLALNIGLGVTMNSVQESVLQAAANTIEKVVDEKLEQLNNLSEDDILAIRKKRLAELKKKAEERSEYLRLGHGSVEEIGEEREFFNVGKKSKRVVYCFYRPGTSRYTDDLIELLKKIASTHIETKFVLVNAEKSPFLTKKLNIYVIPTLVLFIDGKKVKTFVGLDEITVQGKLDLDELESCFKSYKILEDTFED